MKRHLKSVGLACASALAAWDFPRPRPVVSDGAKRDRLVWSGDLWWAGRNIYYSLGDVYGMRDSIKLLAHAQTPQENERM